MKSKKRQAPIPPRGMDAIWTIHMHTCKRPEVNIPKSTMNMFLKASSHVVDLKVAQNSFNASK